MTVTETLQTRLDEFLHRTRWPEGTSDLEKTLVVEKLKAFTASLIGVFPQSADPNFLLPLREEVFFNLRLLGYDIDSDFYKKGLVDPDNPLGSSCQWALRQGKPLRQDKYRYLEARTGLQEALVVQGGIPAHNGDGLGCAEQIVVAAHDRADKAEIVQDQLTSVLGQIITERDILRGRVNELLAHSTQQLDEIRALRKQNKQDEGRAGVYTASKTIHHPKWIALREQGFPIISTWIDEGAPGQTLDWVDLWNRCLKEASTAKALLIYREPGEVLKGAWVELGAALAAGAKVFAVGIDEFSIAKSDLFEQYLTLEEALDALRKFLEA